MSKKTMNKKLFAIIFFSLLFVVCLFFIFGKDAGPGPEVVFKFEELDDGTYSVGIDHSIYENHQIKEATIPSTHNGKLVTTIRSQAFSSCKKLETIVIPNTIKKIDDSAFRDCIKLEEITLPNRLKIVGDKIFFGCTSLKQVSIPDNVENVTNLFSMDDFYKFKKFNKKNNVQYIGNDQNPYLIAVKASSKDITNIALEESCKYIHNGAFSECEELKSITLPNGLKEIGDWAFSDCKQISTISMPNSVIFVGHSTFYNCTNLKEITLSNNLKNIAGNMFYNCSSLQGSITIPASVEYIGDTFTSCPALSEVVFLSKFDWQLSGHGETFVLPHEGILNNPSKAAYYLKEIYSGYLWEKYVEKNNTN